MGVPVYYYINHADMSMYIITDRQGNKIGMQILFTTEPTQGYLSAQCIYSCEKQPHEEYKFLLSISEA